MSHIELFIYELTEFGVHMKAKKDCLSRDSLFHRIKFYSEIKLFRD